MFDVEGLVTNVLLYMKEEDCEINSLDISFENHKVTSISITRSPVIISGPPGPMGPQGAKGEPG